ncbi:MAG: 2-hydroxyacyl-CoA dehydratase [Actinobacteria bacterium]|nr:2-hydroxyacyl-CoA dehydratase [Actinomycetota bacterium]
MNDNKNNMGITTTVPVEVVYAAGMKPVDLNNLFMSHDDKQGLIDIAMHEGFPQNACAWIKGIFGAVLETGEIGKVIGVIRGDCSGGEMLLEALSMRGIEVIPFSYPYPPAGEDLKQEIERLCGALGTGLSEAESFRQSLAGTRELLREIDEMCWKQNKISGEENHRWLVSSSDFQGDPGSFNSALGEFKSMAGRRPALDRREGLLYGREIRLGYVGVPPIAPDIFDFAESLGARFVFHETQRQFSMPEPAENLIEMYLAYTYPYTVQGRSTDINRECERRNIDGLVHYVQSFCHRNLENVVFNKTLDRPMLTIECDWPGPINATTRARLENFVQVLGENL